jgi:hypothetical protein
MHTTSRPRATPAPSGLLGIYPVPELHLVGAQRPYNPRSPIHWQPTPPPLQYGIDYTFMHRARREPVRWPPDSTITVKITGPGTPARHAALASVVAELRALTRLNLVTGGRAPAGLVRSAVPDGEIHVLYLADGNLPGWAAGQAGLGGAARCTAGCCYVSGFAIINAALTGPDATAEHALATLRHQLAHALGLGHATRRSLLMHHQIAAGTTRYGRGDQHGLALLGPRLSSGLASAPPCPHQDATSGTTPPTQDRYAAPGPRPATPQASGRHLMWCSVAPAG